MRIEIGISLVANLLVRLDPPRLVKKSLVSKQCIVLEFTLYIWMQFERCNGNFTDSMEKLTLSMHPQGHQTTDAKSTSTKLIHKTRMELETVKHHVDQCCSLDGKSQMTKIANVCLKSTLCFP